MSLQVVERLGGYVQFHSIGLGFSDIVGAIGGKISLDEVVIMLRKPGGPEDQLFLKQVFFEADVVAGAFFWFQVWFSVIRIVKFIQGGRPEAAAEICLEPDPKRCKVIE